MGWDNITPQDKSVETVDGREGQPAIALDRRGGVYAVWQRKDEAGYNNVLRHWTGFAWEGEKQLQTSGDPLSRPLIGTNVHGTAWVAYGMKVSGSAPPNYLLSAVPVDNSDSKIIASSDNFEIRPHDISVDSTGGCWVVTEEEYGAKEVIALYKLDSSGYQRLTVAPYQGGIPDSPALGATSAGRGFVTWVERFEEESYLWVREFASDGSPSDPKKLSTAEKLGRPSIAVSDSGVAWLAWAEGEGDDRDFKITSVRIARLESGKGAVETNPLSQEVPSEQVDPEPTVRTSDNGHFMVVWREMAGSSDKLKAVRIRDDGAISGTATLEVTNPMDSLTSVAVALDLGGSTWVLWNEKARLDKRGLLQLSRLR